MTLGLMKGSGLTILVDKVQQMQNRQHGLHLPMGPITDVCPGDTRP